MTPKEKAYELFYKVCKSQNSDIRQRYPTDIRTTILLVDEIIITLEDNWMNGPNANELLKEWQEVKQEIEKL